MQTEAEITLVTREPDISKERLFQLAGLAGVVSGVLLILLDIAFIVIFGDQSERVAAATTT